MNCPFCEYNEKKSLTIIENDLAFAFPTNIPIVFGHTLICPKRHLKFYEDLTDKEKRAVEELRVKLKQVLKDTFGAEGFNCAWNEDKAGGQSISHFHLHIVPRKKGDTGIYEYDPRKFLYRPGSRATTPQEELKEVVGIIKKAL